VPLRLVDGLWDSAMRLLDTATNQPEAMAFYESLGYQKLVGSPAPSGSELVWSGLLLPRSAEVGRRGGWR
jgi:hypothetical protein